MARLIDADELLKHKTDHEMISTHLIYNAPTIDAQPVIHGEWLGTEYDGYSDGFPVYTTWKCSNCGAEFECEDMDFYYCPNCGADMREVEE